MEQAQLWGENYDQNGFLRATLPTNQPQKTSQPKNKKNISSTKVPSQNKFSAKASSPNIVTILVVILVVTIIILIAVYYTTIKNYLVNELFENTLNERARNNRYGRLM